MIPRRELYEQLRKFRDFRYSTLNPHYPSPVPGVRLARSDDDPGTWLTNCCTFVEGLILPVAAEYVVGLEWNLGRHDQMMVLGYDKLAPVAALVDAGLADRVTGLESPPPAWSVVQGWSSNTAGHTFIIESSAFDLDDPDISEEDGDKVLILEANRFWGLDGVGRRGIGNLRDCGIHPPRYWWRRTPWTWSRIRSVYSHALAVAALRVDGGGD